MVVSKTYAEGKRHYTGQDWAVIRLEKAFGDVFGWMNLLDRKYDDYQKEDQKVNLVGYSGDRYEKTPGAHYNSHFTESFATSLENA